MPSLHCYSSSPLAPETRAFLMPSQWIFIFLNTFSPNFPTTNFPNLHLFLCFSTSSRVGFSIRGRCNGGPMASLTCTLLNGNEKKCYTCFKGVEHGKITPRKIMAFFSIQTNSFFCGGCAIRCSKEKYVFKKHILFMSMKNYIRLYFTIESQQWEGGLFLFLLIPPKKIGVETFQLATLLSPHPLWKQG